MIGLEIHVRGADAAAKGTEKEIDKMVGGFLQVVIAKYRQMFEGSRSGRLYRKGSFKRGASRGLRLNGRRARGAGSRIHRASAPGEPLAKDSGKTAQSYTVRRLKSGVYRLRFGGGVTYWEFRDSQRRPTLMPAIEAAAEEYFG